MNKFTTLTVIAGLMTAFTTMSSEAAFTYGRNQQPVSHGEENCADKMGHMRRVTRADITAIDGQEIVLIPICEELSVPRDDEYGALFINGNVEKLRLPIARNDTLMSALAQRDYDQHDVISIRFGAHDSIILYVHQREMN